MRRALEAVAWTAAFALAYAQSPLYTSNQNQYFLHGLARAGVGTLRQDWLANTVDPTPLFSWMVWALAGVPWSFYLVYAVLMGVYLFSLASIVASAFDLDGRDGRRLLLAGLIVIHSAALRYLLAQAVAPDAEFVFEGGVAGQRLLGAVLQPSAFGVLLVLSLALFLRDRRIGAVAALGAACAAHPTYLLSAGMLLAGYVIALGWRRSGRTAAVSTAAAGGALLGAIAVPVYLSFRPGGPDLYALASEILIRYRIPHHAIPEKWLDPTVAVQAAIVISALCLIRRSRLFPVLLTATAGVVSLTAVQMLSGSPELALLFPWRLSAVIIPVSTACLLGAGVALAIRVLADRPGWLQGAVLVAGAGLVLTAVAGLVRFTVEMQHQRDDPAGPMMEFVAASVGPGEVYFIDPKLQDFRLRTGAPVVVEAKAIPYLDREVVDWWDRLKLARNFYRSRPEWSNCEVAEQAGVEYGATHVVLSPEQLGLQCPRWVELFNDGAYAVYRLDPAGPTLAPGGRGVVPEAP